MNANYNGIDVDVNEEGFLTDLNQWQRPVAEAIAKDEGIEALNDQHWDVIGYLQDQHRNDGRITIRSIGKSGVVTIKEFYQLFPGKPLKKAARISGIPKPASCI